MWLVFWGTLCWGTLFWGTLFWGSLFWGTLFWGTLFISHTRTQPLQEETSFNDSHLVYVVPKLFPLN